MMEDNAIEVPIEKFYNEIYLPSLNMDREIVDALNMLRLQAQANNDKYVLIEKWLYELVDENKQNKKI
jgi:hypothetical protein